MKLTMAQLQRIMPYIGPRAATCLNPLNAAMERFNIDTPRRQAAFLAQLSHESAQLAYVEENLNYSAKSLMRVWPKRFPTLALALEYAYQPSKIANFVYANRGGNGDVASGDGWRYRGAGWIQLTFKDNHAACADHFGIPHYQIGGWLRQPAGAALSAAWYWSKNGCNELADRDDVDGISDIINLGRRTRAVGDAIGYSERLALTDLVKKVLA